MSTKTCKKTVELSGRCYGSLALVSVLSALACPLQTQGQVTLTNGNSQVIINPSSQAGMSSWDINGQTELAQQWFWYSVGSSAPQSIDTLALTSSTATTSTLDLVYTGTGFTIGIDYNLVGGPAATSYSSDVSETMSINNTSGSSLSFQFYKYSNFQLMGGAPNTVTVLGSPGFGWYAANQFAAMDLTQTLGVGTPAAAYAEAELVPVTKNNLNNGVNPVTLSDNTGAGPGNVSSAFQWSFNIGAGSGVTLSTDDNIQASPVPEPSVLALIPSGLALLGLRKRFHRA